MANINLGQFYQAILQGAREGTLEALKNKDFATQTTLLAVLNRLADLASEDTLDDVKGLLAALGATSDAAETDPTETASQIALLKGLLTGLNQVAGTVSDGAQKVTLTGHTMDLRGLAADRPAANSVDIGVTYWSVDTGVVEVSDGTKWVMI